MRTGFSLAPRRTRPKPRNQQGRGRRAWTPARTGRGLRSKGRYRSSRTGSPTRVERTGFQRSARHRPRRRPATWRGRYSHLTEGQRDHDEVDALGAQRDRSRQKGESARRRRARPGPARAGGRRSPWLDRMPTDRRPMPEERGVPETHQGPVAEDQVQGHARQAQRSSRSVSEGQDSSPCAPCSPHSGARASTARMRSGSTFTPRAGRRRRRGGEGAGEIHGRPTRLVANRPEGRKNSIAGHQDVDQHRRKRPSGLAAAVAGSRARRRRSGAKERPTV